MLRHIRADWEKTAREIIYVYAGVADDLYGLDASGAGTDLNPLQTSQDVREKLIRGEAMYVEWKDITPKGNEVVRARFFSYRVAWSTIFRLLNLYFELISWINQPSSIHRSDAIEIASRVKQDYAPWFLVTRDIPVISRGNYQAHSQMIRRMVEKSMNLLQDSRVRIQAWAPNE